MCNTMQVYSKNADTQIMLWSQLKHASPFASSKIETYIIYLKKKKLHPPQYPT